MAAQRMPLPWWYGTSTEPRNCTLNRSTQHGFLFRPAWREGTRRRTSPPCPPTPHGPHTAPGPPQTPTDGIPGLANNLVGVEGGEDAPLPRPHVVAPVPVVILLQLHQDGVVHIQLQLVLMAGDEPGRDGQKEDAGRDGQSHGSRGPARPPRGTHGRGHGQHGTARLAAHLKTARWVCSRSSPFTMQENSPKDSVPAEEEAAVGLGGSSHPTVRGESPASAHSRGLQDPRGEGSRWPSPMGSGPSSGAHLSPWPCIPHSAAQGRGPHRALV